MAGRLLRIFLQSQPDQLGISICNEKEHHKQKTFQEEYRKILEEFEIDFDEKHIFRSLE